MKRIVIADDHSVVRAGLRQILADVPELQVVGEAGSGEEALAMVRRLHPELLVLDLSMPGRGGLDILKEVAAERPPTRVLVLTIHPEREYAERVLRAGASGYLTKESATSELVTAVERVLCGGRFISASLAEWLVARLGADNDAPHQRLSDREYQVMHRLAGGRSVTQIAEDLGLSPKTVSTYRARILDKLGCKNNVEITRYAVRHGLVD